MRCQLPADIPTAVTPTASAIVVSIIIPVYNRSNELRRVLAALSTQSFPHERAEVLICDDGSREELGELVAEFRQRQRFCDVRHLRQDNRGAGAARNLGIANAAGELLAFTDSDCEPDPDWLSELVTPFADPTVGIAGGFVDYRAARHLSGRCVNFLMSSTLGAGGARDPRGVVSMNYYPRAGNMAVLRHLAVEAGGFPGHSHGEDLEFGSRVMALGFRAEFVPTAKVLHNECRSFVQVGREAFRKGVARVRLARHRGMHELIHALPALLVLYALAAVMVALVRPGWLFIVGVPGLMYLIVLLCLAAHAAAVFRSFAAMALVPLYATLLHGGYGLGYLTGWFRVLRGKD